MRDPRSPLPPALPPAAAQDSAAWDLEGDARAASPAPTERALEPAYALLDLNSLDLEGDDLAWADALLDDPLEGLFRSPEDGGERPKLPEDFFGSRLLPPSVAPASAPAGAPASPSPSAPPPRPASAAAPLALADDAYSEVSINDHPMFRAQDTPSGAPRADARLEAPSGGRGPAPPPAARAPSPPPSTRAHPQTLAPIAPPLTPRPPDRKARVVVAVAGGKGGVGRTLITASLALLLPKARALSVALVDADPCGANLHSALCLEPHLPLLGELLRAAPAPLRQALSVPHGDLTLYRAPVSLSGPPSAEARRAAIEAAEGAEVDVVLLDLGAHPDPLTLDAFNRADLSLTALAPTPLAVERAYSFLRAALFRRLLDAGDDASIVARALLMADHVGNLQTPSALVQALSGVNREAADATRARLKSFTPQLILNHCRTHADRDLLVDVCASVHRKWRISASPLAAIDYDEVAYRSLQQRQRRPLVLEHPGAVVCNDLERLARRVMSLISERLNA